MILLSKSIKTVIDRLKYCNEKDIFLNKEIFIL